MGKKRKKKTPAVPDEGEQEESVDDIFAELKKEPVVVKSKKKKEMSPEEKATTDDYDESDADWKAGTKNKKGSEPTVHRFTSEGLPVYKYYHLGMAQNDGGTPLCPFDCDCCF